MRVRERREITCVFLELWLRWRTCPSIDFLRSLGSVSSTPDMCSRWPSTFFLPLLFCNYLTHCDFHRAYAIMCAQSKCGHVNVVRSIFHSENLYIMDIYILHVEREFLMHKLTRAFNAERTYRIDIATGFACTVTLSLTRTKLQRWSTVKKYWSIGFFGFSLPQTFRTYRKRWRQAFN